MNACHGAACTVVPDHPARDDDSGKEIWRQTEVPSRQEVGQVASELRDRVTRHLQRQLVGHDGCAEAVEVVGGPLEGEALVERLAGEAALIVPLSRDPEVDGEAGCRHGAAGGTDQHAVQEAAPPPCQGHERRHERQIARFRKSDQPQQHGGRQIGASTSQPCRKSIPGGSDFLVEPDEIGEAHEREVEGLGRQEHGVEGHDGCAEKGRARQGGGAGREPRGREEVEADEDAGQKQDIEGQQAVQTGDPGERRRDERIEVRLAEEQAIGRRRGALPALEEDAVRTPPVDAIEAGDVLTRVREVAIMGDAEGHGDVGGFIALDAVRRANDVHRQGGDEQHGKDQEDELQGRIACH